MATPERPNLLAYGDNLDVLRLHVASESVDLVYLDPPFNSKADYNMLFAAHGEKAAAQIKAFGDTWAWDTSAAAAYQAVVEAGGAVATTLRAFRTMLGASDMLAYLSMMAPRLVELHRVLKPTGSLFLHCDPTASHYLKLLMDAVFGPSNFRNEIIWAYTGPSNVRRWFPRKHDVILFYARGPEARFYPDAVRVPYAKSLDAAKARTGIYKAREYENLDARMAAYDKRGKLIEDWWSDITPVGRIKGEVLGYPTQKPRALLERIIQAASNQGDLVLDPFCGCGTMIDAAQVLDRRWIGIDITHFAIGLIKHRLTNRFGPAVALSAAVIGEPTTEEDAATLAAEDPFQFQAWALGLIGARQGDSAKRGGDRGIDGRIYFHEWAGGPSREIVISVKAGHLLPAYVRDLVGVVGRESAEIGALLSFEEPSAGMRAEAASAGFYVVNGRMFPRIQLRTIAELLGGRRLEYPTPMEAPTTLWPSESIPVVPRTRTRRPKRHAYVVPAPIPVDFARSAEVRTAYKRASQEEQRSPQESKRDPTRQRP